MEQRPRILIIDDEHNLTDSQRLMLTDGGFEVLTAESFDHESAMPFDEHETFGLIGNDPKLQQIIRTIQTAAPSDASILIEGDSGTGKDLIAAAIHACSRRSSGPLIRVDCSALAPELIEPELFGDCEKPGALEAACGGTLVLAQFTETPLLLQMKLLQVLETGKLRRLGADDEVDVNFRLLSLTSRNTSTLLEEDRLRKDLYFRISTIKIKVPSLCERRDDLPLLTRHFLRRFSRQFNKKIRSIAPETLLLLLRYNWPGNIRELETVIEGAVLFCQGTRLLPGDLPEEFRRTRSGSSSFVVPPFVPMAEIEREAILQTLERTSGNVKRSAQILRFPRPTFYRKLKKLGITVARTPKVATR